MENILSESFNIFVRNDRNDISSHFYVILSPNLIWQKGENISNRSWSK